MGGEEIPNETSKKMAELKASGFRVRDLRLLNFPSEETRGASFLFSWPPDRVAKQDR